MNDKCKPKPLESFTVVAVCRCGCEDVKVYHCLASSSADAAVKVTHYVCQNTGKLVDVGAIFKGIHTNIL